MPPRLPSIAGPPVPSSEAAEVTAEVTEYTSKYAPLFAHSPQMRRLRQHVERIADTDATVMVRGESGTGKEVIAKAIHLASSRRDRPFVKVNCAALPGELLESELFGHEKGAFTGAYRRKPGKFELASHSTIFLDEIGELPIGLQAKLLHVLQDHQFARVGGAEVIEVDVRIIASTNRDLLAAARLGHFREDLYYRLKVVELRAPALRERPEEIPILANMFVKQFNELYRCDVVLGPDSMRLLMKYSWPGNVRELENMMKRVVVLGDEYLLQEELTTLTEAEEASVATSSDETVVPTPPAAETLKEISRRAAREAERRAILAVLERVRWNRAEAARCLGIGYKCLLYKMEQCGLPGKLADRRSTSGSPVPE
jgi:two-component system, NtrC family, response regulator AtoC